MPDITKDRIKDQMLRTAARLWGLQEQDIEATFDPLLRLVIEACAAELEKIGYDINASHERLLDKLADQILPEALLGPKPATSVMHAAPVEALATIVPLNTFSAALRNADNQSREVYFSPVGEFTLHGARLTHTLIGDKLFKTGTHGNREQITSHARAKHFVEDFWLVIALDEGVKTLQGLSLFFDLHSHTEASSFYTNLETAKVFVNGHEIDIKSGFHRQEQFDMALQDLLWSGDDYTKKMARHAAGVWSRQFLSIESSLSATQLCSAKMPEEWRGKIEPEVVAQLGSTPLIYLRVLPGRMFQLEALEAASISINAFPVLNRRFHTLHYRTDAWINIVPIRVEEAFLDLHSISGPEGAYRFRNSGSQDLAAGEAIVRSAGVRRINSHDLRSNINSLAEAIRDESAFFNELNNDFIQERLREIGQVLAKLEDKVRTATNTQESYQYLLLRPYKPEEEISINYWTTDGTAAHEIKAGSLLTPVRHSVVNAKGCYLLTGVYGGSAAPGTIQKRTTLKQQLQSRGKIVSAEDVRLLSLELFGNRLQGITVRKGVQTGVRPQEGFMRSIDVLLKLAPAINEYEQAEQDYLCSELEYRLVQSASPIYPFRVLKTDAAS